MKKQLLLLATFLFMGLTMSAQVIDVASKDGYIKNTSTTADQFLETTAIEVKTPAVTHSRVGFVELPVNELVASSSVTFKIYFYNSNVAGDISILLDGMQGAFPDGLSWATAPADEAFTSLGSVTVNNTSYGWVSLDVTDFYNAAIENNADDITIRLTSGTDNPLVKFYSIRSSTDQPPQLEIVSSCERAEVEVDTMLCAGGSLVLSDRSVTTDGVYNDTLATFCGADSVISYYTMFVDGGTVDDVVAICEGDDYKVQIGPREYSTYTTAGTYTDVVDVEGCVKTINTTLTINSLPVPQDLGDDVSFREGDSIVLDGGAGFAAYQWLNDDALLVSETDQKLNVKLEKDAFHLGINEIEVQVIDDNGCVGGDDIWVEIIGNRLDAEKDCFIEEAGDRLLDITRLEVKNDVYGDQNTPEGEGPFYTKETFLAFDISGENLPEEIENVRLRMYLYGVTQAPTVTETVDVTVDVEYIDGLYNDAMIWTSRPITADRTKLGDGVAVNKDNIGVFVEWDINNVFVSDILGKMDQFSIILSSYTDQNSTLAKFKEITNANMEWHPALVYDIVDHTGTRELESAIQLLVYPNPSSSIVYVKSDRTFNVYKVYNMLGQQLLEGKLLSNSIDISSLAKGNYILKLEGDQEPIGKIISKQ